MSDELADGLDNCGVCNHPLDKHEAVAIGENGSLICWEEGCDCNHKISAKLVRMAQARAEGK